jgi:NADH dehydrogenase [ubiquinone] 1 alpha subcomplex assembly factor 7
MDLHLLETSPVLRKAQETALKGYDAVWHSETESIPADSPLMIIGNEFLDALPAAQFVWRDTPDGAGWQEKVIKLNINDTLRLYEIPASEALIKHIPAFLIPPKEGVQVEVSLEQKSILDELMNMMKKQGGIALFVDYGFIHSVPGDTLQALTKHRYTSILDRPGEVDITTHVNFAEISAQAMGENMTVHGPVAQGDFLNLLGLGVRAQMLHQNASPEQRRDIDAAVKRLSGKNTKDGEMGDLFKVIAIASDPEIELAGFA